MRLEELDFDLPVEAIAQRPVDPRDSCQLMRLGAGGVTEHLVFRDLPGLLARGDTLVFNDSKVLPARVMARKPSGGDVELLFLQREGTNVERWQALARPSKRLRVGSVVSLAGGEQIDFVGQLGEGRWVVQGPEGRSMLGIMEAYGRLPLPPYIRQALGDESEYQTVYAAVPGSAAAPTAGLHFTQGLLSRLEAAGVGRAHVTLHVGLDTFLPIRERVVENHRIHTESYFVQQDSLRTMIETRRRGGRLVAVGTTAARVLETLAREDLLGSDHVYGPCEGSTDIYITPGHKFLAVDALLTNFHLPRSSVLALTMAFAGVQRIKAAYRDAIEHGYRFFSLGDAMYIDTVDGDTGKVE